MNTGSGQTTVVRGKVEGNATDMITFKRNTCIVKLDWRARLCEKR